MNGDNAIMASAPESAQLTTYNGANPIGAMLNAVVEQGITSENVAAMKELVGLYERMEDRGAKQAFTAAMTTMQSEIPKVIAKQFIPDNNGNVRSRFADYESIMDAIEPSLTKHGFSVSYTTRAEDGRIFAICRMKHTRGHEEQNEFGVRVGKGPPGCSEAQADSAAKSQAKRGALCDALNIVIDYDDNAAALGAMISPEQAASLRDRAKACGCDEARLLKFAAAKSFDDIRAAKFAAVDDMIRIKSQGKPKPKPGSGKGDANAQPPASMFP